MSKGTLEIDIQDVDGKSLGGRIDTFMHWLNTGEPFKVTFRSSGQIVDADILRNEDKIIAHIIRYDQYGERIN